MAFDATAATPLRDNFWYELRYRGYHYYIPDQVKPNAPLLIVIHGHGVDSKSLFFAPSKLTQLADEQGFVIMWPSGGTFPISSWNSGPCCPPANTFNVNDNGFIRTAINRMRNRLPIDDTRIYVMGHSNGASMSHRLALQSADKIAAIAPISFPVINNLSWWIPRSWTLDRKVPVLNMHALDDYLIRYWGGLFIPFSPLWLDSAPAGRDTWARLNGCESNREFAWHPHGEGSFIESNMNCKQDVTVSLLTFPKGSHSPLHAEANGGVDVEQEAWSFLSQYQKPGHKADRMWEGQQLRRGEYLQSADGSVRLELLDDGNLVLKETTGSRVIWTAGTRGSGADRLIMQDDGNLVLYKPGYWSWRLFSRVYFGPSAVWASNTVGSGEERVQVTNEGTFQILRDDLEVWSRN
ncbi:PHB depolymerase family esterase [Alcanivorax sp. 1008]|uniref:PHB depolymerase family esterase n=1 Tax=Alcanivorax sp. 1008 TaxID=2816853 RepID=UPI001DC407FC|nr:PHB depolymerase family esterase [Alcanivorax sp. 1008]MCC1498151.1 hypothetical protein [Alcanivorax sp. 1008]